MNYNLTYLASEYTLPNTEFPFNWLFILATLSIVQLIITSLLVNKHNDIRLTSLKEIKSKYPGYKRHVSFHSDTFYWFWNIFPIIFYAHFFYIEASWSSWILQISMLDSTNKLNEEYQMIFHSNYSSILDIIILLFLSLTSFVAWKEQDKKDQKMCETQDNKHPLYWWSSKFSIKIYWIRKIFLIFNIFLIGFLTYLITKISFFIIRTLHLPDLIISPFHVDGYGGLHIIMQISAILLAMYLLRGAMGVIGLDDHKDQSSKHKFFDKLNIGYAVISIIVFSWFVYTEIKEKLFNAYVKYDISTYLSSNTYQNFIDSLSASKITPDKLSDFFDYYAILSYDSFPLDIAMYYSTIFTAVAPISVWFFMTHYGNNLKEDDNEHHETMKALEKVEKTLQNLNKIPNA